MHLGDILNLTLRIPCRASRAHVADFCVRSGRNSYQDVHLLGCGLRLLFVNDAGLVIAVLLHQLFDFRQCTVEFFPREELAQLKFRCVDHLIGCRGIRRSVDENLTHEEIRAYAKNQRDLPICGTLSLDLNIGKATG